MIKRFLIFFIIMAIFSSIAMTVGVKIINENGINEFEEINSLNSERIAEYFFTNHYNELNRLNTAHSNWTDANDHVASMDIPWLSENITEYLYDGDFGVDYMFLSNEEGTFEIEISDYTFDITNTVIYEQVMSANVKLNSVVWADDTPVLLSAFPFSNDDNSGENGILVIGREISSEEISDLIILLGENQIHDIYITPSLFESDLHSSNITDYSFNYEFDSIDGSLNLTVFFHFDFAQYIREYSFGHLSTIVYTTFLIDIIIILIVFYLFSIDLKKTIEGINNLTLQKKQNNMVERVRSKDLNKVIDSINKIGFTMNEQYLLLKNKNLEIVKLLSKATEINDPYTKEHGDRTSQISQQIGEHLGVEGLDQLVLAARLHDIGKVFLANDILNKKSVLTESEYAEVKNHPKNGYLLLEGVSEFETIGLAILHHHERFDGKGYPDHLSGYDIPLFARIISVADVYDAVTSDRSYRKAFTQTEALEIIKKGEGSLFDPDIVKAFFEIIEKE